MIIAMARGVYLIMNNFFNPSTVEDAYFISISFGLIVTLITGLVSFNCGKNYNKTINKLKQKGNRNISVQNGFIMGESTRNKN